MRRSLHRSHLSRLLPRGRRGVPAIVAAASLLAAACGGPEAASSLPTGTVRILPPGAPPVTLQVEIAETPDTRARGLMGRRELPDDVGMAFLFDAPSSGGFWMKDTLIPLSIAFWDSTGRIAAILDMEPCKADPCPIHRPGVTYVGALEVNRGFFDRAGVEVGDGLVLEREP